jgi:hypothetical protein
MMKKLRKQYGYVSKLAEKMKRVKKRVLIIISAAIVVAVSATFVIVALLDSPEFIVTIQTNNENHLEVTNWGFINEDDRILMYNKSYNKLYYQDKEVIKVFPYYDKLLLTFDESEFPTTEVTEELQEDGRTMIKTTTTFNGGSFLYLNSKWEYSLRDGVLTILQND